MAGASISPARWPRCTATTRCTAPISVFAEATALGATFPSEARRHNPASGAEKAAGENVADPVKIRADEADHHHRDGKRIEDAEARPEQPQRRRHRAHHRGVAAREGEPARAAMKREEAESAVADEGGVVVGPGLGPGAAEGIF